MPQRTVREPRQRGEREQQPAEQPERDHDQAEQDGLLQALQHQRQRARHDVEIEELLDQRVHQALRHAKRVSSKRPSATTGMNRMM